jgi:hypothetical protein
MAYRALLVGCLVLPLASALYSGLVLPVFSGAMLIGLSQFLFYGTFAVNAWFCRRSAFGTRVLLGILFMVAFLTFGLMILISPPPSYGTGIFVYAILSVQLMIAFAAGYVSCICVDTP